MRMMKSIGEGQCGLFDDVVRVAKQVFYANDVAKAAIVKSEATSDEDTDTDDDDLPIKRCNVCVTP